MLVENTRIETLITKRPKTVSQQYKEFLANTEAEWMLSSSEDAVILTPIPDNFQSEYDFVSFEWVDVPKIYGRKNFGIGLFRVSALREAFKRMPDLPSEGLELFLEKMMWTQYSTEFKFRHNAKLTMKAVFRYGKGRAYFNKCAGQFTLPNATVQLKYLKFYFAYGLGLFWGMVSKTKDNNW